MKQILLTQGKVALVDDADFDWLNQWKWHAHTGSKARTWYAARWESTGTGRHMVQMHRQILALTNPRILGEHEDGNGLNNQRHNLRVATSAQNGQNRRVNLNNKSEFKGVSPHLRGKWMAGIKVLGKSRYLGLFATAERAARVYDRAARRLFGKFARLNFP